MKYGNIWFNALDLTINTLFILRVEVIVHFFALLVLQRSCLFQQEICSINHCGVFFRSYRANPFSHEGRFSLSWSSHYGGMFVT